MGGTRWSGPAPIEERFWKKVDKTPTCWNWTDSTRGGGYGRLNIDNSPKLAHRVSWELANGPLDSEIDIDHICRNRACVRPSHLRIATRKQNMENTDIISNNTTGVRGVYANPRGKLPWRTQVGHNKQWYSAGTFATIEEAERAITELRLKLFTYNEIDKRKAID